MIDEKALEAACDAFEPLSSVLRYRGRRDDGRMNWHACDLMAMRAAITAYLSAATRADNAQVQIGQSGVTDGVEWVAVPREPSDAVLLAMLATDSPTIFKKHLRHPDNWPIMAELVEHRIAHEIRRYRAMLAAAGGER